MTSLSLDFEYFHNRWKIFHLENVSKTCIIHDPGLREFTFITPEGQAYYHYYLQVLASFDMDSIDAWPKGVPRDVDGTSLAFKQLLADKLLIGHLKEQGF